MLKYLVLVSLGVSCRAFIVCTPELCEGAQQQALNCPGKVIKNGGFCGCTDACAKQEGESCRRDTTVGIHLFGVPAEPPCDDGLECGPPTNGLMAFGMGECRKVQTKRASLTHCQQMRQIRMISFVIWQGMWTPKCDAFGNFEPMQCDNIGQCFCVTRSLGKVIESTKEKASSVDCSGVDLTDGGPVMLS